MDNDLLAFLQETLQRDWLSPQGAVLLAGVSYAWLRRLGERGRVATLATPLGTLYRRADVERVRAERAARRAALPGGREPGAGGAPGEEGERT